MVYIVLGIGTILVGVYAGLLARRKRLLTPTSPSYTTKDYDLRVTQLAAGTAKTTKLDWYDSFMTEDTQGNKFWYNKRNEHHRENGLPAIEYANGSKRWYINGQPHREDGPAVEYNDGVKDWYLNGKNYTEQQWKKELNKPKCTTGEEGTKFWHNKEGKLHREDGPAIEYLSGGKTWYLNGKVHREDGPAVENASGGKYWWLNGIHYTTEELWKKELDKPKCEVDKQGNKFWRTKDGRCHREDGPAIVRIDGYKAWYISGQRHREDGPAVEDDLMKLKCWYLKDIQYSEEEWKKELDKPKCTTDGVGNKQWKNKQGLLHREDGPAMEYTSGTKEWHINGKMHRTDGPAMEWAAGNAWFINGKYHRTDGPALELANGTKSYYLNGTRYSEEEYNKIPRCTTDGKGNKKWRNKEGQLHREDGPAIEDANGYKEWVINGTNHREDGPAVERADGTKHWYLNGKEYTEEDWQKELDKPTCTEYENGVKRWTNKQGKLHRTDGPAVEGLNGYMSWYVNGKRHREDGPATIYSNGNKQWLLNGKMYTELEWLAELDPPTEVRTNGDKYWKNEKGEFHRENGAAIEWVDGEKAWFINGIRHRKDGPAIAHPDGIKSWWINGNLHREDGPAVECPDGTKEYWLNGSCCYTEEQWQKELDKPTCTDSIGDKYWRNKEGYLHRENGPAIECANGNKHWFINDKRHRTDGPALCINDGAKYWYVNDQFHREDGPAIEQSNGTREWYLNGKKYTEEQWQKELNKPICETGEETKIWQNKKGQRHREDGPAFVSLRTGDKSWWINGKLHREDGAAVERGNGNKEYYLNGKILTVEEWKQERIEKLKLEVMAANPHIGLGVKINATVVKFSLGQISNFSEIVDWNNAQGVVGEYNVYVKDTDAVKLDSYAYYGEMTLKINQKCIYPIKLEYVLWPKPTTKNYCPHSGSKLNAGSGNITPPKQLPTVQFKDRKISNFLELHKLWGNLTTGVHDVRVEDKDAVYMPDKISSHYGTMVLSITNTVHHMSTGHTEITYKFCRNENSLTSNHSTVSHSNSDNYHNATAIFTIPVEKPKEEPKKTVVFNTPIAKFDKWSGIVVNLKEIVDWNKIVGEHSVYVEEKDAVVINNCAYFGRMVLNVKTEAHFCETITLRYEFVRGTSHHIPPLPKHNNGIKASGSLTLTPPKPLEEPKLKPKLITAIFDDKGKISNMDEIWEACPYVQPRSIHIKQEDAIGAGYFGKMTLNINKIDTWNDMLTVAYRITCLNESAYYYMHAPRNYRISNTVSFLPKPSKKPVLPIVKFKDRKISNLFEIFGELKGDKEKLVYVHKEDAVASGTNAAYGELKLSLLTYESYQYYVFVVNTNTMLATVPAVNDHCKTIRNFQNGIPVVDFKDKNPSNLDMLFCDKIGDSRFSPRISVWVNKQDAVLISGELYHGEMSLAYAINSDKSYCFCITKNTASENREGNPSNGRV